MRGRKCDHSQETTDIANQHKHEKRIHISKKGVNNTTFKHIKMPMKLQILPAITVMHDYHIDEPPPIVPAQACVAHSSNLGSSARCGHCNPPLAGGTMIAGKRETKPPPHAAPPSAAAGAEQAETTSSATLELSTHSIGVRAYGAIRSRGFGQATERIAPMVDAACARD
jgi:hypothetical protein